MQGNAVAGGGETGCRAITIGEWLRIKNIFVFGRLMILNKVVTGRLFIFFFWREKYNAVN